MGTGLIFSPVFRISALLLTRTLESRYERLIWIVTSRGSPARGSRWKDKGGGSRSRDPSDHHLLFCSCLFFFVHCFRCLRLKSLCPVVLGHDHARVILIDPCALTRLWVNACRALLPRHDFLLTEAAFASAWPILILESRPFEAVLCFF